MVKGCSCSLVNKLPDHDKPEAQLLSVKTIQPFPDNPFHAYEGIRLNEEIERIRKNGILKPIIVREDEDGFIILAGQNSLNAVKAVDIKEIPARVKSGITDEEAYVYVIEAYLVEYTFSELLPSEIAWLLSDRYAKILCQSRKNEIRHEIEVLCGSKRTEANRLDLPKRNLDSIGEAYGMSARNIARYKRINHLIDPLKKLLDQNNLFLVAAVELSYLDEQEQELIAGQIRNGLKVSRKMATDLRKRAGSLNEDMLYEIMKPHDSRLFVEITADAEAKYFSGLNARERSEIVLQALGSWFDQRKHSTIL